MSGDILSAEQVDEMATIDVSGWPPDAKNVVYWALVSHEALRADRDAKEKALGRVASLPPWRNENAAATLDEAQRIARAAVSPGENA